MNSIELRSERVRTIIGKMPSSVVRNGITILFVVFILLFIGTYFFPYTETFNLKAQIIKYNDSTFTAKINIPIEMQAKIEKGVLVAVELEGYTKNRYGQLYGQIDNIDSIPLINGDDKFIICFVNYNENLILSKGKIAPYYPSMQGNATIFLKKRVF